MAYCTAQDVYRLSGLNSDVVLISDINKFIEEADAWIDKISSASYNSPTQVTEYFDGERNEYMSFTNASGSIADINYTDWNQGAILMAKEPYHKDSILTSYYPINTVDRIYFLDRGNVDFKAVYSYDGSSYTDNTTEANTVGGTAFYIFQATPTTSDYFYLGSGNKFEGIRLFFSTAGSTGATISWEYYNGTDWQSLSVSDGTSNFTQDGIIDFIAPTDWSKTSINNSSEIYYIRAKISSGSFTTSPKLNQVYMIDVIDTEINIRDIQFESWGEITFMQNSIPDGTRNIKIIYTYGSNSVPYNVRELSASIAAINALVNMMGGSFDDVTSYSIPEMSVSKGEPYTNMRATIVELRKKIFGDKNQPGLLYILGREVNFEVA